MGRWLLVLLAVLCTAQPLFAKPELTARSGSFRLVLDGGEVLSSPDLLGTVLNFTDDRGAVRRIRIDAVVPYPEAGGPMLHDFRVETAPGDWEPLCSPDARGLRLGFPVAGAWDGSQHFVADPTRLFVTCTSGARGKCVLFGYDPWRLGPDGESLIPLYEACQLMVRAAYCGDQGYTTDGTSIDYYDDLGIARAETRGDPAYEFEAGWTPEGATCVAHPRHPEVFGMQALLGACPTLAAPSPCTEAAAKAAGAILFNRSRLVTANP